VDWIGLSCNPKAIPILERNLDKVDWHFLSMNPNAIHLLGKLDYGEMKEQCKSFCEELVSYVFHPTRVMRLSDKFGLDCVEYFDALGL
jgi:hypothetical protein